MLYRDLKQGDRFRMLYGLNSDREGVDIHTKAKGRFYVHGADGRRYTTGAKVPVKIEMKLILDSPE